MGLAEKHEDAPILDREKCNFEFRETGALRVYRRRDRGAYFLQALCKKDNGEMFWTELVNYLE